MTDKELVEKCLLTEEGVANVPGDWLAEADREPGGSGDFEYEDFLPLLEDQLEHAIPIIQKAKDKEWEEKLAAKSIIYAQAGERAVKAERERIIEWGEELCNCPKNEFPTQHSPTKRHNCWRCWQVLKGGSNG